MNFYYRCSSCGAEYEISPQQMRCEKCQKDQQAGKPPRGILEVDWDYAPRWKSDFDLLPVEKEYFLPLPVGNTPLWKSERLQQVYGFSDLWLKNEGTNLTGSLKDRASYLVAAFARKFEIRDIIVASTGNAGSSMAGIGAAYGLNVNLFVPANAPQAKLVQAKQYSADIHLVDGNYDTAFARAMDASSGRPDIINRNTAINPLTIEGKKTAGLEIFRQLGECPDYIFVPVGDGVILSGIYKAFEDLLRIEKINRIPKVIAVQAEGSAAIYRAWKIGSFEPVSAKTVADSIAVNTPANGYMAVAKLKKYSGESITVTDKEILSAQYELSRFTGLFAEPAAAASFAGFQKLQYRIEKDKKIVLMITGSGLKDIESAKLTDFDFQNK